MTKRDDGEARMAKRRIKLRRIGTAPTDALFQEPPLAYTPGGMTKPAVPAPSPPSEPSPASSDEIARETAPSPADLSATIKPFAPSPDKK